MAPLNIGILGSGNIGRNAAIHFLKAGHTVYLANSRGPESLREIIADLGPGARSATVSDAVARAEIILFAVPWLAKEKTIQSAGGAIAFAGRIVIDAMNPYAEYPATEDLGDRTSSEVLATLLSPAARIVKAFNTIYFQTLATEARPGAPLDQRIAIPVCGGDADAKEKVSALIDAIGFAPVDMGGLAASRLQEPEQPLYNRDFTPSQLKAELARLAHGA
jgi:predicted dinucleotide-binding enzyme